MPFPATLSAGQITQVRNQPQHFEHYLLINPNDVVWQAQVNDIKTSEVYGSFEWTNTLQGDRTDVWPDQLMLITTSDTDFTNPVVRGRIRGTAPTADTVTCNELGIDIDTTMYVTVIDDFDLMERLLRVDVSGTQYKDYSRTFEDLPPVVSGLQSVYADLTGAATVSWSFAPTGIAIASGAAMDTYAWDIGDGSFTAGNASTQNITAQFPGAAVNEHRWVHLTVTDDAGNATTFHFEVYTVDIHGAGSSVYKVDNGQLQVTADLQSGYNATITNWANMAVSSVLDQTRCALVSLDNYNGTTTPIVANIMVVGRFRNEGTGAQGDADYGAVSETQYTIEGFGAQLARIPLPLLPVFDDDTPTAWGDITNPTLSRTLVYLWAFHTTFLSLVSFTFDNFSTFISDEFTLKDNNALDAANGEAESVNAQIAFAASGEVTCRRNANYLSTAARAALDTIFNFTTADIVDLSLDLEYGETVGQVEAGGLMYSTGLNKVTLAYIGRAPAVSMGTGHEVAQLNGQILTADQSDTLNRAELSQRAADHLAYINPKARLTLSLMDGFWWMTPTVHQWYTVTLAASDTARGRAYTTADNWLCVSLSYSADVEAHDRQLSVSFEPETQGTNAGVLVSRIPDVNALDFSVPPISGYDAFPMDPLVNYPTDTPANPSPFLGLVAAEPYPDNVTANQTAPTVDVINVPFGYSATINTHRPSVSGNTYQVTVEGDAQINAGSTWQHTFDFTAESGGAANTTYGQENWVNVNNNMGTYATTVGWNNTNFSGASEQSGVQIGRALSSCTITKVTVVFDWVKGVFTTPAANPGVRSYFGAGTDVQDTFASTLPASDTDHSTTNTHTATAQTSIRVEVICDDYTSGGPRSGDVVLKSITLYGTGTNPITGVASGQRGDSFYFGYDGASGGGDLYPGGAGLLVDGSRPSGIPLYADSHSYNFLLAGTDAVFAFTWVDPDGDYSDNDNRIIRVVITGVNMGITAP